MTDNQPNRVGGAAKAWLDKILESMDVAGDAIIHFVTKPSANSDNLSQPAPSKTWKRLGVAIGAVAGGGAGLVIRAGHEACYLRDIHFLIHPEYWVFLRFPLMYLYVLAGLGLGAGVMILMMYIWPRFQKAVGALHLLAGGLAGLGGMIAGMVYYLPVLFANSLPAVGCSGMVLASVLAGMAGAAVLTTGVHVAGRTAKRPRVVWAVVGGIPCGYLAFIQTFKLELPAPLCP